MIKVKDVLIAARDRIARGWTQYKAQDDAGNVCSVFAINIAVDALGVNVREANRARNSASAVLSQAITEVFSGQEWRENMIIDWNDNRRRTKDEVLHTFDHAIKLADRDQL